MENYFALILAFMQWPILIVSLLFLAFSALKNSRNSSVNVVKLFENFRFGGHRGSPFKFPENTIASMEQAYAEGADLVEFDVSLTKDDVAVLLHDSTLDRTTNMTGPIQDFLYNELQNCNCAAKFQQLDTDSGPLEVHALPTLDELIEWADSRGMKMLFDIKAGDANLIKHLGKLFQEHNLYHQGIVCSFNPMIMWQIKREYPEIPTGYTWRKWLFSHTDREMTIPRFNNPLVHYITMALDKINEWGIRTSLLPLFLGVDLLLTERNEISEEFVRLQTNRGFKVCAWTVNDVNEMKWMHKTLKIPFLTDMPYLSKTLIES